MTPTASLESGTGEPIPMSFPVSRGRSFGSDVEAESPSLDSDSGLPSSSVLSLRCGGGAGADRSSLGVRSTPPLPRPAP